MQNLKLVLASLHNSRTVYFPTATTIQKGRRTVLHKRHSYDKCCCFMLFCCFSFTLCLFSHVFLYIPFISNVMYAFSNKFTTSRAQLIKIHNFTNLFQFSPLTPETKFSNFWRRHGASWYQICELWPVIGSWQSIGPTTYLKDHPI